jgi:hypothetical protein
MTGKGSRDVDHGQQGAGLPSMRMGHPPNEKWIERVGAIQVNNRLPRQGPFPCRIESQTKYERMTIEEKKSIIRLKRNLRMAKRERPISTVLTGGR